MMRLKTTPQASKAHSDLCPFCYVNSSSYPVSRRIVYTRPLAYAAITIGAFQIGYFLVIPYEHHVSIASMPSAQRHELLSYSNELARIIRDKQNSGCVWFEHGGNGTLSNTPQSITHCHLHIVPYKEQLYDSIAKTNPLVFPTISEAYQYLAEKQLESYVLLRDVDTTCYVIYPATEYPSQYIRRIICQKLGVHDQWDWRSSPFTENIIKSLSLYSQDRECYQIMTPAD